MTRKGRAVAMAGIAAGLHTLLFVAAVFHFLFRALTRHTGGPLPELRWWLYSAPVMICIVIALIVWAAMGGKR